MQASQLGRRASQTRRPCQMRRCGKRAQSWRGTIRIRSRSIFAGSSCFVSPRRCESRRTCVSTTIPCATPRSDATTFAVFLPTPGRRTSSSRRSGTSPVVLLEQHPHSAAEVLGLLPERPRRTDVGFQLLDRNGEVVLWPPILPEEPFRDAVHGHVGRLRRKHDRDEELDRVLEPECDGRVRMCRGEPVDDLADARPRRRDAPARFADVATRRRDRHPVRTVGWVGGSGQAPEGSV